MLAATARSRPALHLQHHTRTVKTIPPSPRVTNETTRHTVLIQNTLHRPTRILSNLVQRVTLTRPALLILLPRNRRPEIRLAPHHTLHRLARSIQKQRKVTRIAQRTVPTVHRHHKHPRTTKPAVTTLRSSTLTTHHLRIPR